MYRVVETLCATTANVHTRRAGMSAVTGGLSGIGAANFGNREARFGSLLCRAVRAHSASKGNSTGPMKTRIKLNAHITTAASACARNPLGSAREPASFTLRNSNFFTIENASGRACCAEGNTFA